MNQKAPIFCPAQRCGQRKIKKLSCALAILLLTTGLSYTLTIRNVKAQPRTWTVDDDGPADFAIIQEAIDAASHGDTVAVLSGTYNLESTLIVPEWKENISLVGMGDSTIVRASPHLNMPLVYVNSRGFIARNMTFDGNKELQELASTSLELMKCRDTLVENIHIMNSSGIGLYLTYPGEAAPNATVRNVTVEGANGISIVVDSHAEKITFENINVSDGGDTGILVNVAHPVITIRNIRLRNVFVHNVVEAGIHFDGMVGKAENISLENCFVVNSGFMGIWFTGEAWRSVKINDCMVRNALGDAFGVGPGFFQFVNCTSIGSYKDGFAFGDLGLAVTNVSLRQCKAIDSGITTGCQGFMFYRVKDSSIADCQALGSGGAGFFLRGCENNTLTNIVAENNCRYGTYWAGVMLLRDLESIVAPSRCNVLSLSSIANNRNGLWIEASGENTIVCNNFINNTNQLVLENPQENSFDRGYPTGGNYWSDYKGVDMFSGPFQNETGSDGIGDTPYIIDEKNVDNYPLVNPFVSVSTDLNEDGRVNIQDITIVAIAYKSMPGDPNWNELADLDKNGIVNILDITLVARDFGKTA